MWKSNGRGASHPGFSKAATFEPIRAAGIWQTERRATLLPDHLRRRLPDHLRAQSHRRRLPRGLRTALRAHPEAEAEAAAEAGGKRNSRGTVPVPYRYYLRYRTVTIWDR